MHRPPPSAFEKDRAGKQGTQLPPTLLSYEQSLELLWDWQEIPIRRVFARIHYLWGKQKMQKMSAAGRWAVGKAA